MKVVYTTKDGRLKFEFEASGDKEVFRTLSRIQEMYEDEPSANVGGKDLVGGDVKYRIRKAKYTDDKGKEKEAEYYEKLVINGPAQWFRKSFGVLDDGSENLFPKRNIEPGEGVIIGNNGWYKFAGRSKE